MWMTSLTFFFFIEAISTYYKSLCQKASVERRGLNAIRLKERKLRERLNRVCYILSFIQWD